MGTLSDKIKRLADAEHEAVEFEQTAALGYEGRRKRQSETYGEWMRRTGRVSQGAEQAEAHKGRRNDGGDEPTINMPETSALAKKMGIDY